MRNFFKYLIKLLTITLAISAIGLLIWGSISWVKYKQQFNQHKIVINGDSIISEQEYRSILIREIGPDLLTQNVSAISNKLEEHPYVAGVRVSKHYPIGIIIEISERQPIAMLNNSPLLMIDENNVVLPFMSSSSAIKVPILSNFKFTAELFPVGEQSSSLKVNGLVVLLIKMQREYPNLYQNLSEIRLSKNDDYELILEDQPTKIVLGNEISWSKILVLKEFEESIKGQKTLTDYVYLDLRYDNQVITKERQA